MNPKYARLIAGMGANTFGQGVTIFIQLASLPIFLGYWDSTTYGVWLMLSALPSYIGMADVGMVTASGNQMTMALGRGDAEAANRAFQSAFAFMLIVCGAIAVLALPAIYFIPVPMDALAGHGAVLAVLCATILLVLFGGLAETIFRATGRYALITTISNLLRLAEWCGWLVGLALWRSFLAVALGGFVARLFGLLLLFFWSKRGTHPIRWGLDHARWIDVRTMAAPAVSFMVFPLANALNFQGITLLVGAAVGPAAVTVFNTYRTLARVAVQATSILSHALWVEFSRDFGRGGPAAILPLFKVGSWLGVLLSSVLSIALYFTGPFLLRIWTHGEVPFEALLFGLMLVYAAVGGSWHVPRIVLLSTNRHSALAAWALAVAALSLVLAAAAESVLGIEGVAASMLVSELVIALISFWLVQRLFRTASPP